MGNLSMMLYLLTWIFVIGLASCEKPNIIFVLVDDVGWADFNYSTGGVGSIPTPNIDSLSSKGVRFSSHYVHPTCTPSRAALMTGRYAHKTGLPFAMFPGNVAGLPADMPTMPQMMRQVGYSAHMVGKWHLGHSQWAQTPVGRGFQSHVGSFMWDLESYTKQMWQGPGRVVGRDWGRYHENKSYEHFAEERHATLAITDEATNRMKLHKEGDEKDQPLFLYVSYNAAHSPLQTEPDWDTECGHIPHLWRRQFCGMVVGLDKSIGSLVKSARSTLGDNTVVVLSSDNGGSVWFGGNNWPLRSGKLTPFEGGVRVPAFMLDFSGRYSEPGDMKQLVHISDWFPTFLSWAGASHLTEGLELDGIDQSEALLLRTRVRKSVVLEMYSSNDSHDQTESVALRIGPYKIIQGHFRDSEWYSEPVSDMVNSTDKSWYPRMLEIIVRIYEWIFGNGPTDILPHGVLLNIFLFNHYIAKNEGKVKTLLFNLEDDPNETTDLANSKEHHKALRGMFLALQEVKHNKPVPIHQYWLVHPDWRKPSYGSFVEGDCSKQKQGWFDKCVFAHPWLDDDVDLFDTDGLGLKHELIRAQKEVQFFMIISVVVILTFIIIFFKICKLICSKKTIEKEKKN